MLYPGGLTYFVIELLYAEYASIGGIGVTNKLGKGMIVFLLLLGGFYWYYQSHYTEAIATFKYLSATDQQRYGDEWVEFNCPGRWQVSAEKVTGGEVLHHVAYRSEKGEAMGYVQVWTAIKPLEDFLRDSRTSSADGTDVEKVTIVPFTPHKSFYNGYLLTYERTGLQNSFIAREFFYQQDKQIYRLSLFVHKEHWNDSYQQIFNEMVSSLQIKA